MGLKSLKLPTEEVKVSDGVSFTVRGLSLVDITNLVRERGAEVSALFDHYGGFLEADTAKTEQIEVLTASLLDQAPEVAALVIMAAAEDGADADIKTVISLPFPVQIDALEKIGKLTFASGGGPKKVVETVIRVLRGTTDLMTDLRTSKIGLGVSKGK